MSMLVVEHKKGERFIRKGRRVSEVNIILRGSVIMKMKNHQVILETGAVIGLTDAANSRYTCDYIANEDSLLVTYAFNTVDDFKVIFEEQPKYTYAFLHATISQCNKMLKQYEKLQKTDEELYLFIMKQYKEYQLLCKRYKVEEMVFSGKNLITPVEIDSFISKWEMDYVEGLAGQPASILKQFYMPHQEICIGEILRASNLMKQTIENMETMIDYKEERTNLIFGKEGEDLYTLWFDLSKKASRKNYDILEIQKRMKQAQSFLMERKLISGNMVLKGFQEYWRFDFEEYAKTALDPTKSNKNIDIPQEPDNPVGLDYYEYILSYAGIEESRKIQLRELIEKFQQAVSKDNKSREDLEIYKHMTEVFFEIYEKAFIRSLEVDEVSPIMQLFFQFGFFDPLLVSEEKINQLLELIPRLKRNNMQCIYTFYDWLKEIYVGNRNTSKNEFDLDFTGSLRELRKANRITAEEEKMYQLDRGRMVQYEIENMFKSAMKGAYGRGGTYSPVLNEKDITKSLDVMFVTPEKIEAAINAIKFVDFRCFYREIIFYDSEKDGTRMLLQKEIYPDIILAPIIGKQGMMWQESAGVDRESPGRFILPVLTSFDINEMMLSIVASYRWEICRKLQGARWNDITERSLTSEYYDFLQFYKKNKNISADVKEKIKSALSHCKGSFREVFAMDYINWIKYESHGNFRLNKVAREILARYCPFPQEKRMKLLENPMFRSTFSKYENLMLQEETKLKNAFKRYKDLGGEITPQMMETLHFYQK